MTTQEDKMSQILSKILGIDTETPISQATAASTADPNEEAMLRSLFGLIQPSADPDLDDFLGDNLAAPSGTALITVLSQQFQDLCDTLMAIKSSSLAQPNAETLTKLESYLAYAQIEIEALEQVAPSEFQELTPSASLAVAPTQKKNSKIRRLRGRAILFCGVALCLPLALRLGIPAILSSRRVEPLLPLSHSEMDHVLSVQGEVLTVEQPGKSPEAIRLAGISPANKHWQAAANGVISTLLESNQGQVSVTPVESFDNSGNSALIRLPNGTTLQEILLEDGVAKLDEIGLDAVPDDVATTLQKAQAAAQAQHKNIWSPEATQ